MAGRGTRQASARTAIALRPVIASRVAPASALALGSARRPSIDDVDAGATVANSWPGSPPLPHWLVPPPLWALPGTRGPGCFAIEAPRASIPPCRNRCTMFWLTCLRESGRDGLILAGTRLLASTRREAVSAWRNPDSRLSSFARSRASTANAGDGAAGQRAATGGARRASPASALRRDRSRPTIRRSDGARTTGGTHDVRERPSRSAAA
jgi:hypothetical protein